MVEEQQPNTLVIDEGTETIRRQVYSPTGVERVVVPTSVREIEAGAFQGWTGLREVVFRPDSRLEKIGLGAFNKSGLETFAAPPALKVVAQGAFAECARLKRVELNEGLEVLGLDQRLSNGDQCVGVFYCSALEEVVLPSTLWRIECGAFECCSKLREIALPDGLETLCERCFRESGLEYVQIPASVVEIQLLAFFATESLKFVKFAEESRLQRIGPYAFRETALAEFVAPSSLRLLAQGALCMCPALKRVVLNEGLEALGTDEYPDDEDVYYGVFEESALESVELPSTLKRIEYGAFRGCKALKSVELPARLERIGDECFFESALERVVIPTNISEVCHRAFYRCAGLKTVTLAENSRLARIGDHAFKETGLVSFVAPDALREIGVAAFCGCANLAHVKLNRGLERLGWLCFSGTALQDLALPSLVGVTTHDAGLGCNYTRVAVLPEGLEVLEADDAPEDCEAVVVPASVRKLETGAFQNRKALRRVLCRANSALAEIGPRCFANSGLAEITLPPTLRAVATDAFAGCEEACVAVVDDAESENVNARARGMVLGLDLRVREVPLSDLRRLQAVELPAGLLKIGSYWFAGSGVRAVCVPASVFELCGCAFEGAKSLQRVVFGVGSVLEKVGAFAFGLCTKLHALELPASTRVLGRGCFAEAGLEEFTLPQRVAALAADVFRGCKYLRSIAVSEGLEFIGDGCFAQSSLRSFQAPASLRWIGESAFAECGRLRSVALNTGLQTLGPRAFAETALEVISVPGGVKRLGPAAFYLCKRLRVVALAPGIEEIGALAFAECGLQSIELPASVRSVGNGAFVRCSRLGQVAFARGSALAEVGAQTFAGTRLREGAVEFPTDARVASDAF